jgi:hypothetical protein
MWCKKFFYDVLQLHVDSYETAYDVGADLPMMFTSCREIEIVSQCMGALVAETSKIFFLYYSNALNIHSRYGIG